MRSSGEGLVTISTTTKSTSLVSEDPSTPPPRHDRGKVAMFWPAGSLDRTPFVRSLSEALAVEGFHVDIFTARNRYSTDPKFSHPNIELHFLPGTEQRARESVPSITARFLWWVFPRILGKRYRFILGTGIRGLFAGAYISRLTGIPLVHHSVELYSAKELTSLPWKIWKRLERWACRQARFIVIQDELRVDMMMRDNRVTRDKFELLPVAPVGGLQRIRSNFLAQKFNIPRDKKIILYTGSFFEPFSIEMELIDAAQFWSEHLVLVVHSSGWLDPEQVEALHRADRSKRVVISTEPLPYEELGKLIASANVGIAVYKASDENMYKIGWCSGKVGEYLRYGLPLILSDFPLMRDMADKYGAGVAVHDFSEIGGAAAAIVADLESYRRRAAAFFTDVLAPENHLPNILARIDREIPVRPDARA